MSASGRNNHTGHTRLWQRAVLALAYWLDIGLDEAEAMLLRNRH